MFFYLVIHVKLKVFSKKVGMIMHWLNLEMGRKMRWKIQGYLGLSLERQWKQMNSLRDVEVQE